MGLKSKTPVKPNPGDWKIVPRWPRVWLTQPKDKRPHPRPPEPFKPGVRTVASHIRRALIKTLLH